MKDISAVQSGCTLSEIGEKRLLRVALASEFLADVLSLNSVSCMRMVSSDGAAAIFACLAEQLDGVVKETSTMKEIHNDK